MTPKWFSGMMTSKNNLHNLELNLKDKTKKKIDRGNLWIYAYILVILLKKIWRGKKNWISNVLFLILHLEDYELKTYQFNCQNERYRWLYDNNLFLQSLLQVWELMINQENMIKKDLSLSVFCLYSDYCPRGYDYKL